jgi:DNA helicase-2/ATP-dependent DNA helicase PcrA
VPITQNQKQAAEALQHAAGRDMTAQVRLIAGPGTGKSYAIEERVRWLLATGLNPAGLFIVSFTRASARDLRTRIQKYCSVNGQVAGNAVSVTTLHALALRILQAANLLAAYPTRPVVMDEWELENIYDAEFSRASDLTPARSREVRQEHEAFWSSGNWGPPNYIPPDPPVTAQERASFDGFHTPRAQTYACVLPGEIVRKCVEHIAAGTLDPTERLHPEHLVVDEYQDLNAADIEFIDHLVARGVSVFIAGDDDQSIYSFRYASPQGIQTFSGKYPGAGLHTLNDCFRCTPTVVSTALHLIQSHPLPNRIPKNLYSLYAHANPALAGTVDRWRFATGRAEARGIAESCQRLIQEGVSPSEILILISNRRVLERELRGAFNAAGLVYQAPRADIYRDLPEGRLALALLRIVCDVNDYVAHRTVLGLIARVGAGTCNSIAVKVLQNGLNFRALFYAGLPAGVFGKRETDGINKTAAFVAGLTNWGPDDPLQQHDHVIRQLLGSLLGNPAVQAWQSVTASLPPDMTLIEIRDYLWADTDEQAAEVLANVHERLGQQTPPGALLPPAVRMMTMHGAKDLNAQIVFIPGLEEQIFPGDRRRPYPGLVLEAARLLYVSVSRARAACILTYARTRFVYGETVHHAPSRFATSLDGPFAQRTSGLTPAEAQAIAADCAHL